MKKYDTISSKRRATILKETYSNVESVSFEFIEKGLLKYNRKTSIIILYNILTANQTTRHNAHGNNYYTSINNNS